MITFLQIGFKKKGDQAASPSKDEKNGNVASYIDSNGKILGKNYFRDENVNLGFYSKKRDGVADVDPKVSQLSIKVLL